MLSLIISNHQIIDIMKKLSIQHSNIPELCGSYRNDKLLEYVCMVADEFAYKPIIDDELNEQRGESSYPELFGICYNEKSLGFDPQTLSNKYEKDKELQSWLTLLKLDKDKFGYLLLWTVWFVNQLNHYEYGETEADKINSFIEMIASWTDSKKDHVGKLTLSEGRKGGRAITIDNPQTLLLIGKAVSDYFEDHMLIGLAMRTPEEQLLSSSPMTDTERRFRFYEILSWFINKHRENNEIKVMSGINIDKIISRLAVIGGLADEKYIDGGIGSTISQERVKYKNNRNLRIP